MTGPARNPDARRRGHVTADRWTAAEWEAVRHLTPWQRRGAVLDLAHAAARDREADEPVPPAGEPESMSEAMGDGRD